MSLWSNRKDETERTERGRNKQDDAGVGKVEEKKRKLKLKAAAAEGVNRRERFIAKLSWDAEKPG